MAPIVEKRQFTTVATNSRAQLAKVTDLTADRDNLDMVEFRACLKKLNDYHTRACGLNDDILHALTEEAEIESQVDRFEVLKEELADGIALLEALAYTPQHPALSVSASQQVPGGQEDLNGQWGKW